MEWWSVVMAPDVQWGAGNTGALIGLEHINILGSLGDVLESRLELTSASPGGFNIQAVRDQCEEWKATIAETGMPANFRNLLVESLDHLIWLVDNSDKFGYARVARAAEAVTGQLAMSATHLPEKDKGTWKQKLTMWTVTLAAFSAFMVTANDAIEASENLIKQIEPGVSQVMDMLDGGDDTAAEGT